MKVKIVNNSGMALPGYETLNSAGMDLRATVNDAILPGERTLIKTGLSIELPVGYEAQIRTRSGMALKTGVIVANSPGTIDADYRGDVGVILLNTSNEVFSIHKGDRIAQMVVAKHERVEWNETDTLSTTDRGEGGFGHTGK